MSGLRREDGFTMAESLVAILLLIIGALATFQLIDASRRTSFRAEESQAINTIAQRELEKIRVLDFDQVALTGLPPTSSDPRHPGNRVALTPDETFRLTAGDGGSAAELVINGGSLDGGGQVSGGQVIPTSTFGTSDAGDISGQIFRYVVWRNDPTCLQGVCTQGARDYKRVIVAVKVNDAPISSDRAYQEFQTDISDPEAGDLTSGSQGGGAVTTAQQFWLSDKPCQAAGEPAAGNPASNHSTNDTTGNCTDSKRPDALLTEAPPDPFPNDPALPDQFDYANDVEADCELTSLPTCDGKGLQMGRQDVDGCDPTGGEVPADDATDPVIGAHKQIHWWATRRLRAGTGAAFVMSGRSTLELWTRTLNDVQVQGAICIYLRERPVQAGVELTPVPLTLSTISSPTSGFSCSVVPLASGTGKCETAVWPYGAWRKLRITMQTTPSLGLGLDSRLEIGISVERGGTPSDVLQILYDHPTFDSRLEIITTTPL